MNCTERLVRALSGQKVDRTPITCFLTGVTAELMDRVGIHWPEAHQDPDKMVELSAAAWKYYGIESLKIPFCMTIEAEALGSEVDLGSGVTLPQISKRIYTDYEEVSMPDDFLSRGRIPTVLEAISLATKRYGEEIPTISSVVGPFTLAGKLFDFQDLLVDLLVDPDRIHELMKKLTDICIYYAQAQIKAGTHIILVGEASCSGDLLSPKMYEEFILPYHKKLAESLSIPLVVHMCGNCTGHLPYIAQTGFNGFSFDYKTDIQEAHRWLDGKMAIIGYLDPLNVFLYGSPELVREKTAECLHNHVDVLSTGCAWSPVVPRANIEAFVQGARETMGL